METPPELQNLEPFRQWLKRQIGILVAVILVVGSVVLTERQNQMQGGSSTALIEETQSSDPVDTGAIPTGVEEEPWMKEYGHD